MITGKFHHLLPNRKSPQGAFRLEIQKLVDSLKSIHADRPKPTKQPALPRLRDAKERFVSRRKSEPVVQQTPIQIPIGKPVPAPTIKNRAPKIEKLDQALKGHAVSYMTEIQDSLDTLNHFRKTKEVVESHLKSLLKTMKGFKFIITVEVTFEKNTFDSRTGKRENTQKTGYFNSKAKTITNANEIESELAARDINWV